MITLYHGSDVVVEKPNFKWSRESLDFGSGFYTTVNKDQAASFAQKVMIRKAQKYVNSFDPGTGL